MHSPVPKRWTRSARVVCGCVCSLLGVARAEPTPIDVQVEGRRPLLQHARSAPSVASTVLGPAALGGSGQSAADVLERVPGVQITRTGASSDVATASLRGADARQVPVYLAGVRLNDELSGTADLSSVPVWMLERVEVYRGNAPDRADRLGIGGAIFFVPRSPRGTHAGAGVGVGSFGAREAWGYGEVGDARAGSLVAVRRSGADNDYPFVDDRGQRFELDERVARRQNADFAQTDAWAIGRYALGRQARVRSVLSLVDREQGVLALALTPVRRARAHARRLLFGTEVVVPCAANGRCRLELDASALSDAVNVSDPLRELPAALSREVDNQGARAAQRTKLTLGLGSDAELWLSTRIAFETLRVRRVSARERGGVRRSLLPAAGLDVQLGPRLTVSTLSALECHLTRGTGEDYGQLVQNDSDGCRLEPALRLGAVLALGGGVELASNLSRSARAPSLSELYGTSPLVEGNPALRHETSVGVDAGVRWSIASESGRDALSLDAFAFARAARELIRYRRSSLDALSPFNVASARLLGAELALSADVLGHVRLEGAGTVLDPRETTDDPRLDPTPNDVLTNTARLSLSTRVELYHTPALPALERVGLSAHYRHKSSRYADPAGQIVLPAQRFVDFELSARGAGGHVGAALSLKNAFDAQAVDLVGLPIAGRSYHATLRVDL